MKYSIYNLKSFRLFATALLLFAAIFVGIDTDAAEYDVFVLAGQSNMDGRGDAEQLPKLLRAEQRGVLIHYTHPANPGKKDEQPTHSDAWQPLAPGYSVPTRSRRVSLPSKTFGPEVSFARAMKKHLGDRRQIAIIKVSRGGTNLRSDWSPDGYMYKAMIAAVTDAMHSLKQQGHTGVIRGVFWHQGESDSKRIEQYQSELETLIENLRTKLASPALPFVIGELATTKPQAFRAMQRKIAEDNDGVFFVSSAELTTTDKTHFDAASQVILGQRFAEALITISPS